MKNKQTNNSYINQPGINKQNFYKKRNHNLYQKPYHQQQYKQNLTQNNYYEKQQPYWKENSYDYQEYQDNHSFRAQDSRSYFKKKTWYYNSNKKHNDTEYEEEDGTQYNHQYTERNLSPPGHYNVVNLKEKKSKEKKEKELLNIKIYIKEGQYRILRIYKNDDITMIVNKFCLENSLENKLNKALIEKITSSLKKLEDFRKGFFSEKNMEVINKLQKLYEESRDDFNSSTTNTNSFSLNS